MLGSGQLIDAQNEEYAAAQAVDAARDAASQARIAQRQDTARAAAREARAEQHRATQAVANGGPVTQLEEDGGIVAAEAADVAPCLQEVVSVEAPLESGVCFVARKQYMGL